MSVLTMPQHTMPARCHAPHPDPRRQGDACGSFLGYLPAGVEFITTAESAPKTPDGSLWVQCKKRTCGQWNRFRGVPAMAQENDSAA